MTEGKHTEQLSADEIDAIVERLRRGEYLEEYLRPQLFRQPNINLRPQRDAPENTEFVSVSDARRKVVLTTLVEETYYPISAVVADVRKRMAVHDRGTGGDLREAYPKKRVEKLISDALRRLNIKGTAVSQENRQLIMSAFGSLRQKQTRAGAVWAQEPAGSETVSTSDMGPVRERISGLTGHVALFLDEKSAGLGTPDDAAALKKAEVIEVPTHMQRGSQFLPVQVSSKCSANEPATTS